MDRIDEVLAELKAARAELRELLARTTPRAAGAPAASSGAVAPAADLDGKYGDPVIRKDPPRWTGQSFVGEPYSRCSSEYLMSLAGFLDWKADQNETSDDADKRKYAGYDRRDAARARGWATRNEGKGTVAPRPVPAPAPPPSQADDDMELPF